MKFGPQSKDEAAVFALEELRTDIQYEIMRRMKQLDLTQASLAKKIGVSASWVSQILDDDANLTLESISKVFLALESKCNVAASPLESSYYEALWGRIDVDDWEASTAFEIGRLEAADFIFARRERVTVHDVFRGPSDQPLTEHQFTSRCLEAA